MSDHLFRAGDVLHLAAPERDEVIALDALGHDPVRTDIVTRPAPASTRCELETAGMVELARERVGLTVREPRMLRGDCGVDVSDPAGAWMCAECVMNSRRDREDGARRAAAAAWQP